MQRYKISCILIFCLLLFKVSTFAEGAVTLDQYVERVLIENKELQAHKLRVEAATKNVEQANTISNPELELGLENFGLNEIEVAITQPIELGGKRKSRVSIAEQELNSIKTEHESFKLSLKAETYRRLIPLIAFEEKREIIDSIITLLQDTEKLIEKGLNIGTFSETDRLRVLLEIEKLKLDKGVLESEIARQKRSLSALSSRNDLALKVTGRFQKDIAIPEIEILEKSLKEHPAIVQLNQKETLSDLAIKSARSDAIPDLNISGGYLRNNEAGENAVLISASIGLPFFNRNKGGISSKRVLSDATQKENEQVLNDYSVHLNNLSDQFVVANNLVQKYVNVLIPASLDILTSVRDNYQKAAVSFIEVIDALQENLALRMELIEALEKRVHLCTDIFEITGEEIKIFDN